MAEITVSIDKAGKPTIAVTGARGKQCLALTEDLEKQLGGIVEVREETAEMRQTASAAQQIQKLGG